MRTHDKLEPEQYQWTSVPLDRSRPAYLLVQTEPSAREQPTLSVKPAEIIALYTVQPAGTELEALIQPLKSVYILAPLVFALVFTDAGVCYAPCAIDPDVAWDDINFALLQEYYQLVFFSETAARTFQEQFHR